MARKIPEGVERFYYHKSKIPCDEDSLHEFKCHRNISVEELPPWAKEKDSERATRKAVSRTLNGFLNNGIGGVTYLGVIDDGTIKGLELSHYQKDHIRASVKDLLEVRYKPTVAAHRYSIEFVAVVDEESTEAERRAIVLCDSGPVYSDSRQKTKEHTLRSYKYCWCDRDANALNKNGIVHPSYVVEIRIEPWDGDDPRNASYSLTRRDDATNLTMRPFHEDEEGNIYVRRNATLQSNITYQQVATETREEVKGAYRAEINQLQEKLNGLLGLPAETLIG